MRQHAGAPRGVGCGGGFVFEGLHQRAPRLRSFMGENTQRDALAIGAVPVYDCTVQLGAALVELPLTAPSLDVASLVMVNSVAVVPEPSSLLLAAAGLAAMAFARRS